MRGKDDTWQVYYNDAGITPAYAGKRSASCGRVEAVRDHPRLCGEKGINSPQVKKSPGSPPPMRGKDDTFGYDVNESRITPAYAGKSDA